MDEYSKLLMSPLWQRKRLEVMQRDDFTCMRCGDEGTTLNVHHIKYIRGRMPWDYELENFETLCVNCHKKQHGKSSRPATPKELPRIEFNPNLYSDPVRAKAVNDEIGLLQERIKNEEAGGNNFATLVYLVGQVNDLIKERQSLRRIR